MISAPWIVRGAPNRRRRSNRPLLASIGLLVTVVVVACTSATPSASPGTSDALTSGAPAGTGPTPKPTAWPSSTVAAMIALGAADGDFEKMGNDLQTAVNAGSPAEMLTAADSGLAFLQGNQKNIPHLQSYPETKPLGDALAKAYADMIAGLQQIHDSLVAGNGPGVTSGFQAFAAGSQEYGAVRQDLSDKAQQAIFMTRILNR